MTASDRRSQTRPEARPDPRSARVVLSLVLLVGAGHLLATALTGAAGPVWVSFSGVCVAAAVAAWSAGAAVRRSTGRLRGAWMAFGFATLAWLAGGVIRAAFEPLLEQTTAPSSLADLFYLLSAVSLVAGFALLARRPRRPRTWAQLGLDIWVCAGAVFCPMWLISFAPLYREGEIPPAFLLLDLSYPISGILVLCLVVASLLRTSAPARRVLRIVCLAVVVVAGTDTAYALILLNDGYTPGNPIHLGWVTGYLLLAAAPWIDPPHDPERELVEHERGPDLARFGGLVVPGISGAAALTFVVALVVTGLMRIPPDPVLLVAGSTVLAALLARMAWLLLDNLTLAGQLEASEDRFQSVASSDGGLVLMTEVGGTVRYVRADGRRLYGYSRSQVEGRLVTDFVHPEDLPGLRSSVGAFVRAGPAGGSVRTDCRVRAADGTWHHTQVTVCWDARSHGRLMVIARDISDEVALREQLAHLTFHDGLTGLPNRAYFEERAREVLGRHDGTDVAVLFADLDGFTAVNDSVGHASGDHVLAQAARRLRSAVHADDTVARFGGDEFAVLVESHRDAQAVLDLAERLVGTLAHPFHVADRDIALTASVGIVFGSQTSDAAELLRNADVAMSRARRQGGGRVEVFAASMHADVVRRLELGTKLRQAISGEQFAIEYQPLVELGTSRVTGVEALVRWWREGTLVPPEEFIRYAEESGLIVPIGQWVLREACAQMARWRSADWQVGLCVNLSPRQVSEPRFVQTVAEVLAESGLSPGALTLEVTEDVLVDDAEEMIQRLHELRRLGVRLAIDDFGTGYASLAYLRQLPVDTLKIDPSFVSGLGSDEVLTLLTRTVVSLGQDLGLLVVAEGIERPDQLELLRAMGCPRGQGYLVARPMAARGVESLLRTGDTAAARREAQSSVPM